MTDTSQGSGSQGGGAQGGQPQPGGGQQQGGQQQPAPRPAENPNTRGVSPARDQREAAARAAGQQSGAEQQSDQQQPGSQPPAGNAEVTIGDIKISPDRLKQIMQQQGEIAARELTLPKDASGYELKVPDNFKLPAGLAKFEFNPNDPFLAQARQLALARKIDQSTFSEVLGLYAGERIAEMTKINSARTAEIAKLGSLAPSRIDAVKTWAHGTLGSDLGGAIEQMLVTAKHVEAFEKIINNFSRQGGTQFSQGHREGEPPKGTIPGYENMSFEQKRAAQMRMNPPAQRTYRDTR